MRPLVSFLLSTLQIFLFLITKSYSQDSSLITICSGSNYNSSSPYPSNLQSLITRITATAPKSPNLFSTDAVGNSSSEVFGLAQCRPDATSAICAACLNRAAGAALGGICGRNKSASVRYDYCLLRYSEQRFFSIPKQRPVEVRYNTENSSQPVVFAGQVERLLQQVSLAAAVAESRFAVNSSELGDVYLMAWCTRDLLSNDCLQCLYGAMALLPMTKVGAQAESVSCAVRFDNYMFFTEPIIAVPPIPSTYSGGAGGDNSTSAGGMQNNNNTTRIVIGGVIGAVALLVLFAMIILLIIRKMKKIKLLARRRADEDISSAATLMLDLATIRSATNNFSEFNKLGEGGFGPVYKGVLRNGQEIAVKRLAKASGQGLMEMRNEVVFVAKLQHKNLVRLVGCCLEENEKLLVYEYLPNTSLDKLLFDPTRRVQLDWETRYKIIEGICRGLLYLHEDSRFRIIHRDLKASNILLGANMEPKISDFGLAKLSGIYETHCNTSRISGTYGYMSPEYAFHGLFSTKSDVFSYGVLVLEIVTGQSSSCFLASRSNLDFLSYVWQYWNQGMALQLVDRSLGDRYPPEQALRCIQIGLLCVQEDPAERPSMSSLVVMLSHHSVLVPVPSMPQFLQRLQVFVAHSSETDMPRSDYSNRHGDITTSDCLSSSSGSIRLLSPPSPLAN